METVSETEEGIRRGKGRRRRKDGGAGMTEGQSHVNVDRASVFTIIWVILMATGLILMSQFSSELIGFIILSSSVPFAVVAMYYLEWLEDDDRKVKP